MPSAPASTDFITPVTAQAGHVAAGCAGDEPNAPAPDRDRTSLQGTQRDLMRAVCENQNIEAMLDAVAGVVAETCAPIALFYFRRDEAGQLVLGRWWPGSGGRQPTAEARRAVQNGCPAACDRGQMQVDRTSGHVVLSVPVFVRGRPPEAIAMVLSDDEVLSGEDKFDRDAALLQLSATHASLWHVLREAQTDGSAAETALPEFLRPMLESPDLGSAAAALANGLQQTLGCDRVAVTLGRRQSGAGTLEALSGLRRFDRRSELARLVESAARDSVVRGELIVWTANRAGSPTHQKLASATEAECVVSLTLRDREGRPEGACVLWGSPERLASERGLALLQSVQGPAANCLGLVARARCGPFGYLRRAVGEFVSVWKKPLVLAVAIAAVVLLALPMTHKIACDCRIEPVTRRFISAPYDGILERALVDSGDVVSPGQVLARMDGREIRWELASLYADRAAAMKRRDAAMASHDAGKVQFARLDLERLDLKIRVLEQRAEHLELKSPIGGIVIRGDLDKAEGAPLTVGQTLFEIAPLDQMTVELAVPEDDVSYVREDQTVRFFLDAYPGRRWEGAVEAIHPRAEEREHNQVFVAEFDLENSDQLWKPGMSGRAKIRGSWRPAGWILFHKAWERAAMKLGW